MVAVPATALACKKTGPARSHGHGASCAGQPQHCLLVLDRDLGLISKTEQITSRECWIYEAVRSYRTALW